MPTAEHDGPHPESERHMGDSIPKDELPFHYGPVYVPRPPLGDSLAACRPGPHDVGALTATKSWVNCEQCKQTEAYHNGH